MEMITVLIGKRKLRDTGEGPHSAKTEVSLKEDKAGLESSRGPKNSKFYFYSFNLLILFLK